MTFCQYQLKCKTMIKTDFIKEYEELLRRLTIIALSLDNTKIINKATIADKLTELYGNETKFDVSHKTIERDINYIKNYFGLKYECVDSKDYRFTNLNDVNKLAYAMQLFLSLIMESSEVDKSIRFLAETDNTHVFLNMMYINVAIKNRQTIKIKYKVKYLKSKNYYMEIEPYEVVFNYGRWYLIGFSVFGKEFRQYIIPNIEEVEFIKQNNDYKFFLRNEDFSLENFYSSSLKVFRNLNERRQFKVWFSKNIKHDIELLFGLFDLTIEELPDGGIIASFSADGDKELINWIWQFGREAKILSPQETVDNFIKRIYALKNHY